MKCHNKSHNTISSKKDTCNIVQLKPTSEFSKSSKLLQKLLSDSNGELIQRYNHLRKLVKGNNLSYITEYRSITAQLEIKLVVKLEQIENDIKSIELGSMNDNTLSLKPSDEHKHTYNELLKTKQQIKHMLREFR